MVALGESDLSTWLCRQYPHTLWIDVGAHEVRDQGVRGVRGVGSRTACAPTGKTTGGEEVSSATQVHGGVGRIGLVHMVMQAVSTQGVDMWERTLCAIGDADRWERTLCAIRATAAWIAHCVRSYTRVYLGGTPSSRSSAGDGYTL